MGAPLRRRMWEPAKRSDIPRRATRGRGASLDTPSRKICRTLAGSRSFYSKRERTYREWYTCVSRSIKASRVETSHTERSTYEVHIVDGLCKRRGLPRNRPR